MACGCQKTAGAAGVSYIYVDDNGVGTPYSTEVEARAAMIRNGGVGFVKTA